MLNNCSVTRHPCFVSDIIGNVYCFPIKLTTSFQTEIDILSRFKNVSTYCQFMVSFKFCMYVSWVALGLHCCSQASSRCGKQGLCCSACASLVAEHRLQARRLQELQQVGSQLWHMGLVALSDVESSLARNAVLCPLPWQVDASPLYQQGSPTLLYLYQERILNFLKCLLSTY